MKGFRYVLIGCLVFMVILLSSCNQGGDSGEGSWDTGTSGIDVNWASSATPPPRFFYSDYSDSFEIDVLVKNKGSSYSKGGVYLSGFNPDIFEVEGYTLNRADLDKAACGVSLSMQGSGDSSSLQGGIRCEQAGDIWYGDEDNYGIKVESLGSVFDLFGVEMSDVFGDTFAPFLENLGGEFRRIDGKNTWGLDWSWSFGDLMTNIEYLERGVGLITWAAPVSFSKFNGDEYTLGGRSAVNPIGDMEEVSFPVTLQTWKPELDRTKYTFMVTNCYMYSTFANPMVCIDPMPDSEDSKVCQVKRSQSLGTQGAPVAITRLEQESTPKMTIFTIYFRNSGNGDIIDLQQMEKCSPYYPGELRSNAKNAVYIALVRVGENILKCTPQSPVRITNSGEGVFTCIYDHDYLTTRSGYETPLAIELWYGYKNEITKSMELRYAG
jgi:hypothetical protein